MLAEYVKAAFAKWKTDHPETDFRTLKSFHNDEKLLLIITRKALRFNRDRHVDNDNFECRRVQNAICSALFISDTCNVLSLLNHFEVVDNESECGVEFKIGPAKYLAKEFAEKDFRVPPTSKPKAREGII